MRKNHAQELNPKMYGRTVERTGLETADWRRAGRPRARPRTGPRRPAGAPRGVARVSAHCCLRAGGGCRFEPLGIRHYVHPPQHDSAGHAGVRFTMHSSFPNLAPPLLTTLERPPRGPHSGAARSGASRSGASFPPRAAPHTSPGARGAGRLETDTYSRCDTHTRGSWAVYRASKGLR